MISKVATFLRMLRAGWVMIRHDALIPKEYAGDIPLPLRLLGGVSRLFALKNRSGNPGERFAHALETLGPAYIKFGQILGTRGDMLDPVFVEGLSRLKDKVPPFSQKQAEEILAQEWGQDWRQIISDFSAPIAAASVAQVHMARLSSGEQIAIKILRPNIRRDMARDMDVLDMVASLAEIFAKELERLRPKAFVETARRAVMLELDLRLEAAAASEVSEIADEVGGFHVPKIYWDLLGKDVLVTEWVEGCAVSDDKILNHPDYDPKAIAKNVMASFLICSFDYGVFHADMHEGNMIVTPKKDGQDNRLYLIDFGILGRLSPQAQRFHAEILYGFTQRDYQRIAEVHFDAGYVPQYHSVDDFASALRSVGEPIFGKNAQDVSMSKVVLQLFEITDIFDMKMQPELILLQKTMMQSEGVCRRLDPQFDIWKNCEPIVSNSMRRILGPEGKLNDFLDGVDRLRLTFEKMPEASENLALLAKAWVDGKVDLSKGYMAPDLKDAPQKTPLQPIFWTAFGGAVTALGLWAIGLIG